MERQGAQMEKVYDTMQQIFTDCYASDTEGRIQQNLHSA